MRKVLVLVLVIAGFLLGQSAEELMKDVQKKYESIESFSAEFTQLTNTQLSNDFVDISGTFIYKKGNKFKINFRSTEVYSNGTTLWTVDNRINRCIINNYNDEYSAFTFEKFIYELPESSKKELIEEEQFGGLKGIRLLPAENQYFSEVALWVNSKALVKRIIMVDTAGTKYIIELKNDKYNINVSDDFFVYSPKEGIKVIDFR